MMRIEFTEAARDTIGLWYPVFDSRLTTERPDMLVWEGTVAEGAFEGSPIAERWLGSFDVANQIVLGIDQVRQAVDGTLHWRMVFDTPINNWSDSWDNAVLGGITFEGNGFANSFGTGDGDDRLFGHGGDDRLWGWGGDDLLDGGAGRDRMRGGAGDDTYRVDRPDDLVIEKAGAGRDTVTSVVSYTLPEAVEVLRLRGDGKIDGTGNDLDNRIYGNALRNEIRGADGDDGLNGRDGVDTLFGGAGDDRLDGGSGRDRMRGGAGDDVYLVDHDGDAVMENAASGHDLVLSWIDFTLPDHVEDLTLKGDDRLTGIGNDGDNTLIANDRPAVLEGRGGRDTLTGAYWDDILRGGAGADTLTGNEGWDRLDGGRGADRMAGGQGNDTYIVEDPGDLVIEDDLGAFDLVRSSISYRLPDHVEDLTLRGSDDLDGRGNSAANRITGNDGDNTLRGNAGNDTLIGGRGTDSLFGGSGADHFVFRTPASAGLGAARDTIFDMQSQEDLIDLSEIDGNTAVPGRQILTFIGDDPFSGTAGEVRYAGGLVAGDTDGDGAANFEIAIDGAPDLLPCDVLL